MSNDNTEQGTEPTPAQQQALQRAETGRAEIMIRDGQMEFTSLDALYRFAKYVSVSGFAPKDFKTPESITVAMVYALELGYSPLTGIQNIAVVNNRPSVWGDLPYAKIVAHADFLDIVEEFEGDGQLDTLVAVCTVERRNRKPVTRRYSWKDAVTAGDSRKDTYQKGPKRMLQWRARWWALKDCFADVLRNVEIREPGETYTAPEVAAPMSFEAPAAPAAVPPADYVDAVIEPETKVEEKPKSAVRRSTAKPKESPAPTPVAAPAAVATPAPVALTTDAAEHKKALRALYGRLVERGGSPTSAEVMSRFGLENFSDLTLAQINGVHGELDALDAEKTAAKVPEPVEDAGVPWEPSPRETLIADLRTAIQDAGQIEAVVVSAYAPEEATLDGLNDAQLKAVSSEVSEWEVS